MPQFNGKQGAEPFHTAQANLRCPRNGKRMNFPGNSAPSVKPLGASEQRAWEGDGNDPPARIPANTVVARPKGAQP